MTLPDTLPHSRSSLTPSYKPGDRIITIPIKVTRNIKNIRPCIASRTIDTGISNLTVHSLLAADLVISLRSSARRTGTDEAHNGFDSNPWLDALPSYQDFAKTTPYFFPTELQGILPKPARDIIAKQKSIIDHDFAILSKIDWPESGDDVTTKEEFVHAWFIVNSRTFHYVAPGQEDDEVSWDDQMALVPIADFINHGAGEGCGVGFSEEGYVITAERVFEKGDELSLRYGRHSNDALMAEYGFIIDEEGGSGNRWDVVDLKEVIMEVGRSYLGREFRKGELEGKNVKIDWEGNVHGDVVEILRRMVEGEDHDELGDEVDERANDFLGEILQAFHEKYLDVSAQHEIHSETVGQPPQWDILVRRWMQIDTIVAKARKSVISR